ncbi:hypothetical protein Vretimale_12803, partial [Volvox reticuliferus]
MPESEVLLATVPRSDHPAGISAAGPEQNGNSRASPGEAPASPAAGRNSSSSSTSSIIEEAAPGPPRRPSIWQLPFCSSDSSWLHVTNSIVYFITFCINVLANSGAVWRNVRAVDRQYGPILTPAGWSYYIRDLSMFLWGLAVACQNLAEHKGWKNGLMACIGHSWQVLWYSDSIWLVLHVMASPAGLTLAPLFSLAAMLCALAVQIRLAMLIPRLQEELQAEGFDGVPALGYLLYMFPTSLASGWLLVQYCHSTTLAFQVVTGSEQVSLTVGCVLLVLSTAVALLVLVRFRDAVFGLAFTWGCVAVWVAGFAVQDDYRPDQLVAFFCALVLGMLTYCVAAGPQLALMGVAAVG